MSSSGTAALLGAMVSLLLCGSRPASACCANHADYIRVSRVFTIPGTDAYLVQQSHYLDWLGDGIGPEWKSAGASAPPAIDDRWLFDYVVYDAELHPLAGVLDDLPRDENGKPALKDVYAKLGALPKPIEDQLRAYQAALNEGGGKHKKNPLKLEAMLAAVPLERAGSCTFEGKVKGAELTVAYSDPVTQSKLPIGEFAVPTDCSEAGGGDPEPVAVTSLRCYADGGHARTIVVVSSHCDGMCRGRYTDYSVLLSEQKLAAMRENVAGYRASKEKDYGKARGHFEKSIALAPDYPHANFNLACALAQTHEDWHGATGPLERLLSKKELRALYRDKIASDADLAPWRQDPTFVEWVRATAAKYDVMQKVVKERALNEAQLKARTANAEGMRLYQRKDYAGASEKFRYATELDPKSLLANTNAASVEALLGNADRAIVYLQNAMKISKPRARARIEQDHDYDGIRETEAFRQLLAE
jgi:tetratricopeptide (TPR) repeat protein